MPAKVYYDNDASLDELAGATVAVLGYGSQGRAHALNLKDSGVDVIVGLRKDSASWEGAEADGVNVATTGEACASAGIISMLVPDQHHGSVYEGFVEPNLRPGAALLFAHGFNIHFGQVKPPENNDVIMVAPKAPGRLLRRTFEGGSGVPSLVAVHQDGTGRALTLALAYAKALGSTRAGVIETTFAEETETDLFGEQAVLCGGVSRLIQAGFETLVDAGYQPEIAYFECLHELKLIVDLLYEGGFKGMRQAVSDTAEYGDLTRGERVIGPEVEAAMHKILADVQSGEFAREFVLENRAGTPVLEARRARQANHPIEEVGARLREMMSWMK